MRNLIEVRNLMKEFQIKKGLFGPQLEVVKAVDGVSFSIAKGESFGLVGESGCGKTTTARLILGLLDPDGGEVSIEGIKLRKQTLPAVRKKMQVVFQDPFSSLNPRWKVENIIAEGIREKLSSAEKASKVERLLEMTGMDRKDKTKYPHQFSGGQRQRIGIARALASEPEFIVLDEPVSSLDVSIQAQVLNLLKDLQKELNLTFLFISHDLSVVEYFCDRIAVMRSGRIVEEAGTGVLFENPRDPYTKLLISSIQSTMLLFF
ncbi:MAG: ATP-binding cassette domain-containing protein [Candidatus Omnitrophota bacterium]